MADYPPPHHILRDLRLEVDLRGDGPRVRVPVVRELCGPDGSVRAGVLGVALDVFGGNLAVEAAAPDWALTAQLELHVLRPLTSGEICVTGQPLRAGRTNLVAEARVDDGAAGDGATPYAVGRLTFTRVPARGGEPPRERRGGLLYAFAEGAERLAAPFHSAIGLRELDAATGALELALGPYVENSVGALQGGVVVAALDAAAECAGRALLGRDVATSDLSVHFLALGREGPLRTRATLLRREPDAALFSVALHDAGQADRLASVATVRVAAQRGNPVT
ncbi:MAG TPA: PaaI family thioesterase [Myxococcota bacterium]|nr:PaaI family thioesterase [Myxococcota bacterium]